MDFCYLKINLVKLKNGKYKVLTSTFKNGTMNYGETLIKGKLKNEILFSTYICHPSMVNNELSGPVISAALISYINSLKNLKYSYRFLLFQKL